MGAIGKILNPIGAIAPKRGIGRLLDPAGAIGRKMGGTAGALIDPAGYLRKPEDFEPPPPERPKARPLSKALQASVDSLSSGVDLKK
jgi:hypothetical protein